MPVFKHFRNRGEEKMKEGKGGKERELKGGREEGR